jgi:CheY-like chemotaxis protein
MNLITNAAEAIGENAGVISLTTGVEDFDAAYLTMSWLSEKPPAGRFAFVEVSDTGCGMDEETTQRLFDPFFSTKFAGRGLGMSAVLGIVRGHGGAIVLRSAIGCGSTIRVLFPASAAPFAAVSGESAALPARQDQAALRGTILIVDDEDSVRRVCMAFARRIGLRALAAADGEEALTLFRSHADEIGCVLLDLTMPRMDGIATFRELKLLRPEVPVILCSGYDEQQARMHFSSEGLAGFVQKPFSLLELQRITSAVLNGRAGPDSRGRPPGN